MPTMTQLLDGTVPIAADFMGNFNALNRICGTGTAIAGYTTGDILYASATDTLSALAKGSSGQVLTMGGSNIPTWAASAAPGAFHFRPQAAAFPATNFPQLVKNAGTNWVDYTLDYDTTTSEAAYWFTTLPAGITINSATLYVFSRQGSLTTGTAGWTITTLSRGDADAWDTAGASDTVTASNVKGTAGQVLMQSKALTITNWGASRQLLVKIARDVADTVAEDVKFIGAVLVIS